MLMNINNWVMMIVMMVRVSSWVSVNSLVVMMDCFVMDWFYIMGSIAFHIMRNCIMWHKDVIGSGMMVMIVIVVAIVVIMRVIVSVLKLHNTVLIIVTVGAMINFMISFVVYILMSHIVVFGFTTFYMWFNFMNGSLL